MSDTPPVIAVDLSLEHLAYLKEKTRNFDTDIGQEVYSLILQAHRRLYLNREGYGGVVATGDEALGEGS